MTDWYQIFTGRPSPGRRSRERTYRYLDNPETEPRANAPLRGPVIERRGRAPMYGETPRDWAFTPRGPDSNVPLSVAAGQESDPRPFGDDFVTWMETTREPVPEHLRVQDETLEAPVEENPGREPTYENNLPLGIEGGTRRIPTRLEMGAHDRAPTVEQTFGPLPRAWDEARQAGIRPDFDTDAEWAAAVERSRERWRSGKPSVTDMFFAAVFGNRGSTDRMRRETEQMRDEIRNDRR